MKQKNKLSRVQQVFLIIAAAVFVFFTAVYGIINSRPGFEYMGVFLTPKEEDGTTVYSGKIKGVEISFTKDADGRVFYQYGPSKYGPYTLSEDPEAVPQITARERYTGIEIRDEYAVVFRGGIMKYDGRFDYIVYRDDGTFVSSLEIVSMEEPAKGPSEYALIDMFMGPALKTRGEWYLWFIATFIDGLAVIEIVFAEAIFRRRMMFMIREPENAEPSDFEMFQRYLSWLLTIGVSAAFYISGLM